MTNPHSALCRCDSHSFRNVTKPDVYLALIFTLTNRVWHFFDVMAGSVPRWVMLNAGMVEAGKEICGPGITMLSLGSSAA